jgi:hypothetical protein
MRGHIPSAQTAESVRSLIYRFGDRGAARLLGISRATATRAAARLPLLEAILYMTEAKLPALLAELDEG